MENVIGEPDKIFVNTYFPNKLCDWCKPIASKEEHDTQIILPAGGVTGWVLYNVQSEMLRSTVFVTHYQMSYCVLFSSIRGTIRKTCVSNNKCFHT